MQNPSFDCLNNSDKDKVHLHFKGSCDFVHFAQNFITTVVKVAIVGFTNDSDIQAIQAMLDMLAILTILIIMANPGYKLITGLFHLVHIFNSKSFDQAATTAIETMQTSIDLDITFVTNSAAIFGDTLPVGGSQVPTAYAQDQSVSFLDVTTNYYMNHFDHK